MIRTVIMIMIALLMVSSAHAAQLLEDSIDYADSAAMRTVWTADTPGTTGTEWTYTSSGLSFANHFASAGGAMSNAANSMAYAELDSDVQFSSYFGDSSFAGKVITFYTSYLISVDSQQSWMQSSGISLFRGPIDGSNMSSGLGSGVSVGEMTRNLQPGNRADGQYSSAIAGDAITLGTTYLVLAKHEYTTDSGYNPWSNGSLDSMVVFLTESDAYPTAEAAVSWDITDLNRDLQPGDPDLYVQWLGILSQGVTDGSLRVDEMRVGTEFADVMNVPEPATMSLLAAGGLAILRRRRR